MANQIKDDLVSEFVDSATKVGATVSVVDRTAEKLHLALLETTKEEELILFAYPDHLEVELFQPFLKDGRVIVTPTIEQLSSVSTGVTDAFCAVASTGSVCVPISRNLSSPVSLLTRKHIAVVDADTIVKRPRDIFLNNELARNNRSFSFITGPSATADMGPLVIGVHGPGQLHIIVLV